MKNASQLLLGFLSAIGSTVLVLAAASLALLEGGTGAVALVQATETPLSSTPSPLPSMVEITVTTAFTPTITPTEERLCQATPKEWLPYTVQQGDTITSLAIKSGIPIAEFLAANCFKSESQRLEPGWVVYMPPTVPTATPTLTQTPMPPTPTFCGAPYGWVYYVVQYGDTLSSLSRAFGVSVYELQRANCLTGTLIYAGQVLRVPYVPTRPPFFTSTPTNTPEDTPVPPTWTFTPTPVTPTVTTPVVPKQDQTITFAALGDKTYGDASFTISASASSGLPVAFSAAGNCTVAGDIVTLTGAGSCAITAEQPGDSSFNPAVPVTQTFQIMKADQAIDFAQPADKTAIDPPFGVSATATSGLPVTLIASGSCSISGSTVSITGVGSCSITASQDGDSNYNPAAPVSRTFQITQASQTINFGPLPNRNASDLPFSVSATATSGLPVSFAASGNCTIAGITVTLSGPGSCTVTASQSGNSSYLPAADVSQTFQIN